MLIVMANEISLKYLLILNYLWLDNCKQNKDITLSILN